MSCWVVPTIAAEVWGISVELVLQRIRSGELPHRVDEGFMFVDVAPPPPPTYTALSEVELAALRDGAPASPTMGPTVPVAPAPAAESAAAADIPAPSVHDEDDETNIPGEDEASTDLGDWRAARQRVSRTRVPPGGRRAKPRAA